MSTPTKVFIVLVLIFSVALSAMTVLAVARHQKWKQIAEDWRTVATAAAAEKRNTEAQAAAAMERLHDQLNDKQAGIASRDEKLAEREDTIKNLQIQLAGLQKEKDSLAADLTKVSSVLEVVQAQAARQQELISKIEAEKLDLRQRNLDLNERNKELTANVTAQKQQLRSLQEELYARQQEIGDLRKKLEQAQKGVSVSTALDTGADKVQPMTATVTAPIRGQVKDVEDNVVSISVGSADGVTRGMTFVIYRGATYLGLLKVAMVDHKESAGTLVQKVGQVRQGDLAADEAHFGTGQ